VVPSVQRRKVWLTPTTGVPCSNAANTQNPLKLAGGATNYQTDLSRWWAEAHHIVETSGGHTAAQQVFFRLSTRALVAKI